MRKKNWMDERGANRLRIAIVSQAVRDYMEAIVEGNESTALECESFFKGTSPFDKPGWYDSLCPDITAERLIRNCRQRASTFASEANQHQPAEYTEEAAKACAFRCPLCGGKVETFIRKPVPPRYAKFVAVRCKDCGFKVKYEFGQTLSPLKEK